MHGSVGKEVRQVVATGRDRRCQVPVELLDRVGIEPLGTRPPEKNGREFLNLPDIFADGRQIHENPLAPQDPRICPDALGARQVMAAISSAWGRGALRANSAARALLAAVRDSRGPMGLAGAPGELPIWLIRSREAARSDHDVALA
jgi:hypothetical protein